MSYFGLNPDHDENQRQFAKENPGQFAPGFFDGVFTETGKGLYGGLVAKPELALTSALEEAVTPAAQYIDKSLDTTAVEDFIRERKQIDLNMVRAMLPSAETAGTAGQILNNLADVGSQGLVGTLIGGPAGAAAFPAVIQGVSDFELSVADGMDEATAAKKASIVAGTTAIGALLPVNVGLGGLKNIAFSAGANVAMGMAHRGLTGEALREGGYADMAQQYDVMDTQALAIDGILGTVFGGLGNLHDLRTGKGITVKPSDVDAALTLNNAIHAETDAAPGIPLDPYSRTAHIRALEKAASDVNLGQPVDVTAILRNADFAPKKLDSFMSDIRYLANEFYPDIPFVYADNQPISGRVIDQHIAALEEPASLLMNRGERERLEDQIHALKYGIEQEQGKLDAGLEEAIKTREVISKRGGRQQAEKGILGKIQTLTKRQVREIKYRIGELSKELSEKESTLREHVKGGKYYEARNKLNQLKRGEIPDDLKTAMVQQSHDIYRAQSRLPPDQMFAGEMFTPPGKIRTAKETAEEETAAINRAADTIEESDMVIPYEDDNGDMRHVSAREIMEQIDNDITQAKEDSSLFQTAIQCFLNGAQ